MLRAGVVLAKRRGFSAQGAAFQHAELVEQEIRVAAGAVEVPVLGRPFMITMGRPDWAIHIRHDILQPVSIMEAVDPLPVQIGQRFPVLGRASVSVSNRPTCEAKAACASTARLLTIWRITGPRDRLLASMTSS